MNQTLLTQDGYERLASECARLRLERDRAAERLRHSVEFGGITAENGEYIDAQQHLERINLRLAALEGRLADAEIVAAQPDGMVDIGESVVVLDLASGEVSEYHIVGAGEADPSAGAVSYRSPVGRALLGRSRGDLVDIEAPSGRRRVEILGLDG
jgi:transcription elongation factor GreA